MIRILYSTMKKTFVLPFRQPLLNRLPESLFRHRKKQGYVKLLLQAESLPIPDYVKPFTGLPVNKHWNVYIPEIQYATDNAAMIAISGYFKYLKGEFSAQDMTPAARLGRL